MRHNMSFTWQINLGGRLFQMKLTMTHMLGNPFTRWQHPHVWFCFAATCHLAKSTCLVLAATTREHSHKCSLECNCDCMTFYSPSAPRTRFHHDWRFMWTRPELTQSWSYHCVCSPHKSASGFCFVFHFCFCKSTANSCFTNRNCNFLT